MRRKMEGASMLPDTSGVGSGSGSGAGASTAGAAGLGTTGGAGSTSSVTAGGRDSGSGGTSTDGVAAGGRAGEVIADGGAEDSDSEEVIPVCPVTPARFLGWFFLRGMVDL
jgi:hypothetical protein